VTRQVWRGYEVTAHVLPDAVRVPRATTDHNGASTDTGGAIQKESTMQIDKQQILEFLRSRGDQQQADQADGELPDQVDTDQHADLLSKFGINPQELLGGGLGDIGGKLGL
jgi:hypothetical protein